MTTTTNMTGSSSGTTPDQNPQHIAVSYKPIMAAKTRSMPTKMDIGNNITDQHPHEKAKNLMTLPRTRCSASTTSRALSVTGRSDGGVPITPEDGATGIAKKNTDSANVPPHQQRSPRHKHSEHQPSRGQERWRGKRDGQRGSCSKQGATNGGKNRDGRRHNSRQHMRTSREQSKPPHSSCCAAEVGPEC